LVSEELVGFLDLVQTKRMRQERSRREAPARMVVMGLSRA
jgi:hypothetical protein